ncbi:arylsulfatase J-like isoform X1 [Mytilus californianus]|uniref:arylsulfatase J-like isoform X1 n=2 Tax=Mytilus californianus TaxID=6549 RepID=UPI0022475D77|nr:arylsulfatase J-like isoform X1 [Mytilus californianus]
MVVYWKEILAVLVSYQLYCVEGYCKRKTTRRPHIVLIVSDDQGWNDVSWHNPEVLTPHMDKLAKQGVKLENHYAHPVCSPSRGAILTGKYSHRLGLQFGSIIPNEAKFLPESATLLPEMLKEIGYTTHMTGKWHLGDCNKNLLPTSRGFDSFTGLLRGAGDYFTRQLFGVYDFWENETVYRPQEGSYNTDLFTQRAVEIIEKNNPKTSPLFLYVPYTSPHSPLQVPQKFMDMYPNVINPARRRYLGMVSSLDEGVGTIADALEKSGHMDNTVFIFLSDNGGNTDAGASNIPLRGIKGQLWEGGSKSAGFVYSPRFFKQEGCVHEGMIHAVDWFPTILDMADFNKDNKRNMCDKIDGVSQWKYIQTCQGSGREEFVYQIDDYVAKSAAIRVGDYKMIVGDPRVVDFSFGPSGNISLKLVDPNNKDIRLFNLKNDPTESNNLASRLPDKVKKMKIRLDELRKDSLPIEFPVWESNEIGSPNNIVSTEWCSV